MSTPTATRIRQARHSLRMTQEEFARAVQVGVRSVPDWESGKARPRIGALRRISELTGVPLDELAADDSEAALARVREEAAHHIMSTLMGALSTAIAGSWDGVDRRRNAHKQSAHAG
jgi:transcriptional regulator with XRE-family HTH domain